MIKDFYLGIFIDKKIDYLSKEDKEKIAKALNECKKSKPKCLDKFECFGLGLDQERKDRMYIISTKDLKHSLRCVKEKIKDFEHVVDSYELGIRLAHDFEFDIVRRDVYELMQRIEERIEEELENEGLDYCFVSVFSNFYEVYLQFDELDEQEIMKAVDRVKKLDFKTFVLSETV